MTIRWLTIFLDFPAGTFGDGVAFWRQVTQSGLSPTRGAAGEFATLLPAGAEPYLRVQRVHDGPGGHHLDLHIDQQTESLPGAARRAADLGARVRHRQEGLAIMDSPGGFRFCLVGWHGEAGVPGPLDGGRTGVSRADQLCLDIPPQDFDAECAFWAALTGWDLRRSTLPEFAHLERPACIPVRVLLQRRDEAAPGDQVTGHIDFSCTDRRALAARHAELGAQILAEFPHWVAMADPAGRPYCLTRRDPLAEWGRPAAAG
jgi:hypothetical protein